MSKSDPTEQPRDCPLLAESGRSFQHSRLPGRKFGGGRDRPVPTQSGSSVWRFQCLVKAAGRRWQAGIEGRLPLVLPPLASYRWLLSTRSGINVLLAAITDALLR